MSNERFCPHCGERIAADSEQSYCMFCGEPVNDQPDAINDNVPNSSNVTQYPGAYADSSFAMSDSLEPSYQPSAWQTLAAITIVISMLFGFLFNNYMFKGGLYDLFYVFLFAPPVLLLISYSLLFKRANNAATRTALKLMLAQSGFNIVICSLFILLLAEDITELYKLLNWVNLFFSLVFTFLFIYASTLIVRNNRLSKNHRTWINLLGIFQSTGFLSVSGVLAKMLSTTLLASLSAIANYSLLVFNLVALWNMARCEAFANQYDPDAAPDYSPWNRQMLVATIFFVLFFVLPTVVVLFF